ncbi:MAG TPA: HAD-IB family phosphatase [Candidatus Saccharimonadales bacterium]|nr:HAD-IB family phosphatase [Candidatus Saccharimonadales bacterium]
MRKLIFFDLDSTLATIEGLDYLAESKGKGKEASSLTNLAMNGEVKMEEIFGKKIDLLSPSLSELEQLGEIYKKTLVQNAKDVIFQLRELGWEVGIVTGSFLPAVMPVAQHLGIAKELIFTNEIYFNGEGLYQDFKRHYALARSGGKAEILKQFKDAQIVFVGDSVTDLDTQPFVNLFIGFGGVVERKKVKEEASMYVYDLSEVLKILKEKAL